MPPLKLATFNINNIAKRLAVLLEWLTKASPDIVCLQELKVPESKFPLRQIEAAGYGARWVGQPRIFDAFNRDASAGDRGSSVGLGLYIANQIVRAHGGSIAVRSPDRDGTTFNVVLPRRPAIGWSPVEPQPPQLH